MALAKDWHLAKALYIQGLPPSQIAKDLDIPIGTLSQRITRQKWAQARQEMSQDVSETLETRAKNWRLKAFDLADRLIDAAAKLPASRFKELKRPDVQSFLDVVSLGIKAYGLDKQTESGGVRLGVYLNCTPTDPVANAKPAQVVDAEASGD